MAEFDTSSYPKFSPSAAQPVDYGKFLTSAVGFESKLIANELKDAQIEQKDLLIDNARREQAKKQALSDVMSKGVSPDGTPNWNYLTRAASQNPLLADLAPEFAKTAVSQQEHQLKVQEAQRKQQQQQTYASLLPQFVNKKTQAIDWKGFTIAAAQNPATAANTPELIEQIAKSNLGDVKVIQEELDNTMKRNTAIAKSIAGVLVAAPRQPNGQPVIELKDVAIALNDPIMNEFFTPVKKAELLANLAKMSPSELTAWTTRTGVQAMNSADTMKLAFPDSKKLSALEEKVGMFVDSMKDLNIPMQQKIDIAQGVESGRYKVQQDPESKDWVIVDVGAAIVGKPSLIMTLSKEFNPQTQSTNAPVAGPQVTPQQMNSVSSNVLAGGTPAQPSGQPIQQTQQPTAPNASPLPASQDLYGRASQGTGLVPAAAELYRNTIPQIKALPGGDRLMSGADALLKRTPLGALSDIGAESVRNREALNMAMPAFINMMTINSKNPVYEQKIIRERYGLEPSIGKSVETLRDRMKEVNENGLADIKKYSEDIRSGSAKERQEAKAKIRAISDYLRKLNVPGENNNNTSSQAPSAGRPKMSPQQAQELLRSMGERWD